MTLTRNRFVIAAIAAVLLAMGAVGIAFANASFFGIGAQTSVATSSPAYMTPGTATSTVYWDTYQTQGGVPTRPDLATLLVLFNASNTSATLGIALEFADNISGVNCVTTPTACDWYRNYVSDPVMFGTTTPAVGIGEPFTVSWKFASSTMGGSATTSPYSTAAITVPTPTRYMRAVLTMTGGNGAVWARLAPVMQYR